MKKLKPFNYIGSNGQEVIVLAKNKKSALKVLRLEIFPGEKISKRNVLRYTDDKAIVLYIGGMELGTDAVKAREAVDADFEEVNV